VRYDSYVRTLHRTDGGGHGRAHSNQTVHPAAPAEVGTHAGLLGAFIVAGFDTAPSILYAETAVEGQTIEKPALVSKASVAFDRLRAEALPRGASRDLIGKVAEEQWTP
jgi:Domain of unknown function (DUF5753)